MGHILQSTDLSETEKAQRYGETLFKLQNSLQKARPTLFNSLPTAKNDDSIQKSASVTLHDQILQSVPKTMKRKAELLLSMIKDNNNLTWDEQGVVSYKGVRIHGSNIIDLINDTIRQRKGTEPRGWKTFSKALHESNIPREVIGNSNRWRWMQKAQDKSLSKSLTKSLSKSVSEDEESYGESDHLFHTPKSVQKSARKSLTRSVKKSAKRIKESSPYMKPEERERLRRFYTKELLTPPNL